VAAYCTKADLVRRYGAQELGWLTDETIGQDIDDTEVDDACTFASRLIDSYLGRAYTLPLSSVPLTVKEYACDIARVRVMKDRASPDSVAQRRYTEALAWLRDVADGKVELPDDAGSSAATAESTTVAVVAPTAFFTDDDLFAYEPA
jgi:phage gp36-like protein